VLAVYLSLGALGYAKRKTQELGLSSITYRQGDILELGSLGRDFDVIESTGVLHHLADPWAGWRVLLSLLRPGGFMEVALYSGTARRNIAKARSAAHGYETTTEQIRECRQELLARSQTEDFKTTVTCEDFFSISNCRDLIFHVQEHPTGLDEIDAFLRANDLTFLGFEVEAGVLDAYRRRFHGDPAAVNLSQWRQFEQDNPDVFFPMYQFWIQKAD
jgi:SAM-dependent methyltransferase